MMHRDIKPENIVICSSQFGGTAKICDFGTVRRNPGLNSVLSVVAGTSLYYSPERFIGNYDNKADIWALGIILYQLLTRDVLPFQINLLGHDITRMNMTQLEQLKQEYMKAKWKEMPKHISLECLKLLEKLLEKKSVKRPDIIEVLKMPII